MGHSQAATLGGRNSAVAEFNDDVGVRWSTPVGEQIETAPRVPSPGVAQRRNGVAGARGDRTEKGRWNEKEGWIARDTE